MRGGRRNNQGQRFEGANDPAGRVFLDDCLCNLVKRQCKHEDACQLSEESGLLNIHVCTVYILTNMLSVRLC